MENTEVNPHDLGSGVLDTRSTRNKWGKKKSQSYEMVQEWYGTLSSIPGTYMNVRGENKLQKVIL